jgi:nucleoside-diphosphate-sugar epimerase
VKILITGSSSFTGCWFACALADAGHEVVATFTQPSAEAYGEPTELRRQRVDFVLERCQPIFGTSFGDDTFLQTIQKHGPFDTLCHHGADVRDYKSDNFDVQRALACNTHRIREVLETFKQAGGQSVVLTGSVFEGGEGAGSDGLPDFSPYGLSKRLTAETFRYYCRRAELPLGKFVIPNPFGPYEEPRFTAYLMRTWLKGETATVKTPDYVRDNIHVELLAACYHRFVEACPKQAGWHQTNPSGYIESQGRFAERVAQEMRPRLNLPCDLELAEQAEFSEPLIRVNINPVGICNYSLSEGTGWSAVAQFYLRGASAF